MRKSINRPEYELFRSVLRELREQAGWTQVQLAKKLRRPQSFVSAVERGLIRQDFLQLHDWCKRCHTTVVDLANRFESRLNASKKEKRDASQ
ncbi:MAG: helix-turn-helix transcriptional regulator [Proteobacteria bacterium]|nr:helix-turn-helix transcriptional regulator [Pseudomonadota bacterium]